MARIPTSTYRLQLHAGFDFDHASAIADYLHDLGISHIYCSPYLQAAPGSMHGYDVVDHQTVNEELGGIEGHGRLRWRLGELGLGQILDIVPNHMALGPGNRLWWDVLENGPASRYSTWFDVNWHPDEAKLQNKVLVPILGDQYGKVLSDRQIQVARRGAGFVVLYMKNEFPVAPRSLYGLLLRAAEYARSDTLSFIADSFARLPAPEATDRSVAVNRHRDKTVIYALLERLCAEDGNICRSIDQAVADMNNNIDALDDLLNQQNYRLAYWRTADQELGYRRFFDVNTLIGLRVEREHVFEETHALILQWLKDGVLDGVRVDHPDGLRDPEGYFRRLREQAPGAWIIGEKILESGEWLRQEWPIHGTSGYDFLNVCNGLLAYGPGLEEMTTIYSDFTHEPVDFDDVAHEKKHHVTQEALGSDVNRLAALFVEICENNRDRRDTTRAEIRRVIREVASCFQVYRTYVATDRDTITDEDRYRIWQAINQAKRRRPDLDSGLFDFVGDVLTLKVRGFRENEFVMRFQQFTSPVMAKGVEDTAFYTYNRMIGLNEVGADPAHNGFSVEEFHSYCTTMQQTHPQTMTTLSTHDTKRADDVRARLAVLTEIPARWRAALNRWSRMNIDFRGERYPDRNTEYFLYQTMIGAWPIDKERLTAYMDKAMREAKQHTTWTNNNREYEDALHRFIERILEHQPFLSELEQMVERVREAGWMNSLTQTLLKYTAPGVPDLYQGGELWDYSLVDPDNRRPVDYDLRRRLLQEAQSLSPEEMMERSEEGLPKLWLIHKLLWLRKEHSEWFGPTAAYTPLEVQGPKAAHIIAYLRNHSVITLAPRWRIKLGDSWAGTTVEVPEGRWKNVLTGEIEHGGRQKTASFLQRFPVALLVRE
ncbi:malto-oligosyltrehalose synthase [Terriglobus albidus]|uniref:malto-oligosyltrehalose synthase n=1 Tax=Terriglobus albidus TaxID=1592106 RepID=UPI0021DF816E|nr:malto-oligosyltrehalose synthase [Terriglobus albidus]